MMYIYFQQIKYISNKEKLAGIRRIGQAN